MQRPPETKSSRMRPPAPLPADPRIQKASELQRPERASEHLRNALQIVRLVVLSLEDPEPWPGAAGGARAAHQLTSEHRLVELARIRDRIQAALDIIEEVRRRAVHTGPRFVRTTVLERL